VTTGRDEVPALAPASRGRWSDFAGKRPEMAERALELFMLADGTGGLGYLATIRADGGPRVHPISPVIVDGRLYAFILRHTPKRRDLHRDGRYALHSWPKPFDGDRFDDEEVYLTGRAAPIADAELLKRVAAATGDDPATGELFELSVERAMHKQRVGGLRYTTWRAGGGESGKQPL
jgi:hypothetical protein